MNLVFDIGMYDGSDTRYYLSEGFKVVAVEANPNLIEKAKSEFRKELSAGQLELVHAAICNKPGQELSLAISGDDLGSSSIVEGYISHKNPIGSYIVKGMTITELIKEHGIPYFIKVDIEGADRYAVLPLTKNNRPRYISFEAGDDLVEIIEHLRNIGYTKFKAINQCNFEELRDQESLIYRIKRKLIHFLGYSEPRYARRNGRLFLLGHSAGPAPWDSAGKWQDLDSLLTHWKLKKSKNELGGWYDIHAM
jgi:FkbM family methyltransferase